MKYVGFVSLTVRRNPEAFIEQTKPNAQGRAVLRVYLGYAAGTGKTCAMLSAAHMLRAEGVDVVVGLVETHGRAGTEALVAGLPMLPRQTMEYRGKELTELDLDAALERRPQVLLVDELAHSNVGGSRNIKRWSDVQELLKAGIEVHTTVNVQHLESVAEVAVADRCVRSVMPVGKGTDTLPGAKYQWFPLKGPSKVLGAAGLSAPVALGARRREDLLEAILNQVSAALERRELSESAQKTELLQASENLHRALLRSVSHDLRIPLVAIQGTLSSLHAVPVPSGETVTLRQAMIANALSEAQRLDRLVGNMLQKTRLETGHLSVKSLPCDVEDLVSTTLEGLKYRLGQRQVVVSVAPDLPLVPMDFVLISQVLTNLLENAMTYSTSESPIEITARTTESELLVEVLDQGVGLGSDDPERLFGCFERGAATSLPGTGLGLSICRGLIEAHRGRITGGSRPQGGSVFAFHLPLEVSCA